ncbi:MAG: hypothetical protein PHQ46_10620 [Negativicutes bacterium]|nr:hypothetical protein [Negativicutes bacterium]
MYIYKSPIGLMKIIFDRNVGKFALVINGTCYGHYHSAVAAADDVYVHETGCNDWDLLDGDILDSPSDISEWERAR